MEVGILHRKERLVITTIEIIDQLGLQKLSTREIARRQGVSEATLFRHFKNKNTLMLAVLDYYSKFDADIYQSTILKGLDSKNAIRYFITSLSEYYENYPAISSIMQALDVLRYESDLTDKVMEIVYNRSGYIKKLVEDAQQEGVIKTDVDSEKLTEVISGFCREICLKWRMEGQKFSLRERTLATLEMILGVFEKA